MARRGYIRYGIDEHETLINRAAQLMNADSLLGTREAILKAQEALPEAKRRKEFSYKLIMRLRREIDQKRQRGANGGDHAAPQADAGTSPSAHAAVDHAQARVGSIPSSVSPPAAAAPQQVVPMPVLLESLAREFGKIMAEEIKLAVRAELAGLRGPARAAVVTPPPPVSAPAEDFGNLPQKFIRHKVAIFGLVGESCAELSRRFPYLDFRFIGNNAKGRVCEQTSKHAQASFIMTKFVAHKISSQVKGERIPVNGGMTELIRLIAERFPVNTSMERASVQTSH